MLNVILPPTEPKYLEKLYGFPIPNTGPTSIRVIGSCAWLDCTITKSPKAIKTKNPRDFRMFKVTVVRDQNSGYIIRDERFSRVPMQLFRLYLLFRSTDRTDRTDGRTDRTDDRR